MTTNTPPKADIKMKAKTKVKAKASIEDKAKLETGTEPEVGTKPEGEIAASAEGVGSVKKKLRRAVPEGRAYIHASYNNTKVTLTDAQGQVIAWASSGLCGFKGPKKSTPYAASVAAARAVEMGKLYGLQRVDVFVKGVGGGREQAIRALQANGLQVNAIADRTPVPHGGCRAPKPRRV